MFTVSVRNLNHSHTLGIITEITFKNLEIQTSKVLQTSIYCMGIFQKNRGNILGNKKNPNMELELQLITLCSVTK